MSLSDPIADLLSRIRNALQAGKKSLVAPASKAKLGVLQILKEEGFITDFSVSEVRKGISEITVVLKYFEEMPAIKSINKISKPGRRVYSKIGKLEKNLNGLGISILSTSEGYLSDYEARAKNKGGEVICQVY